MRNIILAIVLITAGSVKAQPPVRISVSDFRTTVSKHPEVQKRVAETNRVVARSKKIDGVLSVEAATLELELQSYTDEFKSNALVCFQSVWMLEQQIREVTHFQRDVLALKINGNDVLLKQEVLFRTNSLQLFELENKRHEKVAELNALVRHEYGDQPVLPEGWAWSFQDDLAARGKSQYEDQSVRLINTMKNLSESFVQINSIIALQEKLIAKIDQQETLLLLNELAQLKSFKATRWNTFEQIVMTKAALYKLGIQQTFNDPLVGSH